NCTAAIDHYEQFLAAVKDRSKQAVARQAIEACKQRLAEKTDVPEPAPATVEAPPSEPEPPPVEEGPVEAPPPDPAADSPPHAGSLEPAPAVVTRTTHSPWYRDVLGDALVLGGVAAAVGSIVMYRGARSDLDSAEGATTLDRYTEHRDN